MHMAHDVDSMFSIVFMTNIVLRVSSTAAYPRRLLRQRAAHIQNFFCGTTIEHTDEITPHCQQD
ncbi:hypothetical protein DZS_50710 [Dickeya ananatis]